MANKNLDNVQIVVGIDFGTSYSAYAYSYAYEKDKIFTNSDWPSGSKATKEMTAILFNEKKVFDNFGEEAVNKFNSLTDDQAKSWYYFDRFKMSLYKTVSMANFSVFIFYLWHLKKLLFCALMNDL